MRAHWIPLSMNGDNVTYFDSFGSKNIEKETNKFTGNRNIAKNLFRIQAHDSIMCILLYWIYSFYVKRFC